MARHFTASSAEYVQFSAGSLATSDGGPTTIAVLWRPTTVHAGWLFHVANASDATLLSLNPYSDGHLWHTVGGAFHQTLAYTAGDGWRLDIWTKPNGTGQVRGHAILLSGGTWSHTDYGDSGDAPAVVPATKVLVGRHFSDSAALNADIAAIAIVQANWSDAAIEAGNLTTGLSAWETLIGADPAVMWAFDQADVADPVLDLTGGGADQTWRWGTTVVSDPPGFSYLLGTAAALDGSLPEVSASISATAQNAGLIAGSLPSPTAQIACSSSNTGAVAGVLPTITGSIAQTVAVSTPQVTAAIRVRSLSATATLA